MVKELKDKTDVIIALAHIGLDESSVITSKILAENVEGIDIIIDGHSHTLLETGLLVNDTLIAQTGNYDQNLGFIDIEVKNGEIINKSAKLLSAENAADIVPDESIVDMITVIDEENKAIFDQVVATTDIHLDGIRENVRTKETNLGNLAADAVRNESGADVAFVNGGGIRIDLQPGDITFGKVAELFPFGNTVQVKKITGEDLLGMLEHSVSGYPAAQGAFLQVSGITFIFDPAQPVGSRVVEATVGDKALHKAVEYTVAINDFMAIGGDGYEMLAKYPVDAEFGTYEEIFANYLNTNGTKGIEVSDRIKVKEQVKPEVPEVIEPEIPKVVEPEVPEVVVEPEVPETIAVDEINYTVVSGDVLWKIAVKYNTTWQKLAEYNKLANPHLIFPGQIIRIPVEVVTPAA